MPCYNGAVLTVTDLRVQFGSDAVPINSVDGVSFELNRGETLALVGESGSGKSVTALSLLRLLPPPGRVAAGTIRFEGQDLAQCTDRDMRTVRGKRMGMVFQEP